MELQAPLGLDESRKDIKNAAMELTERQEIQYLVQSYYQVQEYRKAASNMAREMGKDGKPCELVNWLALSQKRIEDDVKIALDVFASNNKVGQWLQGIYGIGPVLAAGLIAAIDIDKAPTCGHILSFGGMIDPMKQPWEKGKKRPWNSDLKALFWKIGDSFVKTSNLENGFYGKIYKQRKEYETTKNETGEYADIAKHTLETRKFKDEKTKECYKSGKLPAGRIDLRARRVAIKIFVSHLHEVMTWYAYGERAPDPYPIAFLGHVHVIQCPNAPWD